MSSRRRRRQRNNGLTEEGKAKELARREQQSLLDGEPARIDWDMEMDHEEDESCIGGASEWDQAEKNIQRDFQRRMRRFEESKQTGRRVFDDGWSDD